MSTLVKRLYEDKAFLSHKSLCMWSVECLLMLQAVKMCRSAGLRCPFSTTISDRHSERVTSHHLLWWPQVSNTPNLRWDELLYGGQDWWPASMLESYKSCQTPCTTVHVYCPTVLPLCHQEFLPILAKCKQKPRCISASVDGWFENKVQALLYAVRLVESLMSYHKCSF